MMPLFVDSSAWSRLLRRDRPARDPFVRRLELALEQGEDLIGTGIVLQELLQGFPTPRSARTIVDRFRALELVVPTVDDHIHAAEVRLRCCRGGVRVSTVDALLTAICIDRQLMMLTADQDFEHIARHVPLLCWQPAA